MSNNEVQSNDVDGYVEGGEYDGYEEGEYDENGLQIFVLEILN